MKVRSKDAADTAASFALLFVQNYAILDLSDKIYTGGWWIPKCSFFTALKSDNAHCVQLLHRCTTVMMSYDVFFVARFVFLSEWNEVMCVCIHPASLFPALPWLSFVSSGKFHQGRRSQLHVITVCTGKSLVKRF